MPVELLRDSSPAFKLYGHIVDAVSQLPVSGAQVKLTGANSGVVTTVANGYFEFANVVVGDVQLAVTANGYVAEQRDFRLEGTTEAKIALTPSSQVAPSTTWSVVGSVIDADTLDPLVGVDLVLEEVLPGTAVVSVKKATSQVGGGLAFDGLKESNARVTLSMNGYDTSVVPFVRQASSQTLGLIKLKRSYNAALPDLMLSLADRSSLVQDANTFKASGKVTVRVTNNSNYDTTGFDVIAFLDVNGDQLWSPSADTLLSKTRVSALPAQQFKSLEWDLRAVQLPFRDAPIHLMVDSGLEVIENIEGNNTLRVGVTCGGGGGVQDVGVCIDTSGSVAHLYDLEMEGVIKAVENPNIIPHDGSIRFMLGTDAEMYYGTGIPLHPARVLTPATLPQLILDLKSKARSYGYSSGPTCVRRMSEYMKTLPQLSGSKTVITVGDGYWEGIAQANAQLPITVANGVGRVDVIGVGSPNLPELEANAWPKPVNSLYGGRVTVANSAGDVAAAMAQALGSAAQSADMSLGNFRIVDQGQGKPVTLRARVGSAGTATQSTTVRWYQGAVLLGETTLPAMRSGDWLDVALPDVAIQGTDLLVAVVDEQRINSECNTGNNRQELDLAPANRLGTLKVQTDQAVYTANNPVQLSGLVENLGQFSARFSLALRILDEQGDEVHRFVAADLGTVPSKAPLTHLQPWNTAKLPAGTYQLQGYLLDRDGVEVAQGLPFLLQRLGLAVQGLHGGQAGRCVAEIGRNAGAAGFRVERVEQLLQGVGILLGGRAAFHALLRRQLVALRHLRVHQRQPHGVEHRGGEQPHDRALEPADRAVLQGWLSGLAAGVLVLGGLRWAHGDFLSQMGGDRGGCVVLRGLHCNPPRWRAGLDGRAPARSGCNAAAANSTATSHRNHGWLTGMGLATPGVPGPPGPPGVPGPPGALARTAKVVVAVARSTSTS
jgi:hypothetical protein